MTTQARVHLRPVDGVLTITRVELDAAAEVEGVDEATFRDCAERAEAGCAVSRALGGAVEVRLSARLV